MGNEHYPPSLFDGCSLFTDHLSEHNPRWRSRILPETAILWIVVPTETRQRPEGRGFSGRRDSTSGRTFRFPLRSHRSIWIPHTCPICLLVLGLGTLMSLHVLAPTRIVCGVFSAGRWQSKTLRR